MSASAIFSFDHPAPTPLSPRSHNTPTRSYDFFAKASPITLCVTRNLISMPPTPPVTPPSETLKPGFRNHGSSRRSPPTIIGQPLAQRRQAQNPLARTSAQKQQQKRDEFLEGVRARRDEQMFDDRGDRLLQLDYINERQAWLHWNQTQHIPEPTLELEDDDMVGPSQSFKHTAADPGNINIAINHSANPQQHTELFSAPKQQQLLKYPDTGLERYHLNQSQYDPEIDEVLEAESRELAALVQMHEEVSSSAMEHDPPMWQHETDGGPRSQQDMPAVPSSPAFWGSEDGDDSFEGELWRLADSGGDEEMDLS